MVFGKIWTGIQSIPKSAKITLIASALILHYNTRTTGNHNNMSPARFPAVYIPHGGGPMPILGDSDHQGMITWLNSFQSKHLANHPKPKACLVISAHWEEAQVTVQSGDVSKLYYDYYGFPKSTYSLDYPLPPSPELSKSVCSLLDKAGIKYKIDTERGFDHGVFIPMMLMFPDPKDIPTIQVSLISGLDPLKHIELGEALSPLRDEGILIIGSGMSYHNMRGFGTPNANEASIPFHTFLRDTLTNDGKSFEEKKQALGNWKSAPKGRECHPREEHLIPLMVIFGTSKESEGKGREVFYENVIKVNCAGYLFE